MAKGTKLSEFEKGEITALKRVRKDQREILKATGHSKTVISNYLKSPISRDPPLKKTNWQAREIVTTTQKKNCSRSKKENFVNNNNIEISCGCSLQY